MERKGGGLVKLMNHEEEVGERMRTQQGEGLVFP